MTRGSHPGRRRVRGRAQRRSGWRTGRHSASLSLTLAHPHQRSPAEPARLRCPRVLGRILQASSTASRAAKPGDLAVGALGPKVFCGSLGSAHSSAHAPRTLGVWLEWPRIPGAAGLPTPGSSRLSAAPASPGQPRPQRQARTVRSSNPSCAGVSKSRVTRASLAPKASGDRRRLGRQRPGLPIPGRLWEAQRRAQREPGSARQGEDSGGDGGGAVARRSRLLKGTPPAGSPLEAQRAGDPRAGGSGAQGCGRRAQRGGRGGAGRGERAAAEGRVPDESDADPRGPGPAPTAAQVQGRSRVWLPLGPPLGRYST